MTEIPNWTTVVVRGLVSKPELNGRTGKVSYFVADSGHFQVSKRGMCRAPHLEC